MKSFLNLLLVAFALSIATPHALALDKKKEKKPAAPPPAAADTAKAKPSGEIPSIEKFLKSPAKMVGLTTAYFADKKFYLEIPDSLLGKDLLVVSRISKSASGARAGFVGYAGDFINKNVVRFEKKPNNKIYLNQVSFDEMSRDSTQDMYAAVMRSNSPAIVAGFDIKAYGANKKSYLIDVSDYFNGDNDILFFAKFVKKALKLKVIQTDKSYISSIKTYPINTEIKTVKTYGTEEETLETFELNTSMVLLPEKPMQPRYFDSRVGYFAYNYIDYDQNPQGVKRVGMISRWRLEPKPEDVEKYKRGELVEPQKPIVYYIDPATPKKWVPYLMQGVNDWQVAFEKAGFKNAILAKLAPTKEQDSTWSLEDARYSAIVYKPSDVENASGPHVADPRTGEIMESHINWYHNVMKLLHDWYFVQCAAVDPMAQEKVFDDELMGQLIRFVSSHEVGHTLGLRHNFGASTATPVDSLRSITFLKAHGHTTSIMDYARFDYVAQPEDNIPQNLLFPRIGQYDLWAIEWGYRRFPDVTDPVAELPKLNEWIIEKMKDRYNWFGTETNPNDPRSQREDLGDNHMKSNEYGIKNLQRIMDNFEAWTKVPNEDYDYRTDMYSEILGQYLLYIGHVAKWVGGIYETPKTSEQEGNIYSFVEKEKQQEAMAFLNKYVFTTPTFMLKDAVFQNTNKITPLTEVNKMQTLAVRSLLNQRVFQNLLLAETALKSNTYTITNLFEDLNKNVFKELASGGPVDIYRRNLQKVYVKQLLSLLPNKNVAIVMDKTAAVPAVMDNSDLTAFVTYQLKSLQKRLQAAASADPLTKAHYDYLSSSIKERLQ